MTIIYAVLMFCVLIFVHELGHFIAAKATDVKVNEFALGMGPALWKKQKGETLYALRAIPVGGYCAMEGENEDSPDERAFNNKSPWRKILIVIAGSVMNLLLCLLILMAISFISGTGTTTIQESVKGDPAYEAGIRAGDRLIQINDQAINEWGEAVAMIGTAEDKLHITVKRGQQTLSMDVAPTKSKDGRTVIGIIPEREHNLIASAAAAGKTTWQMTLMMGRTLKQLFQGSVSVDELSGPVGIVYVVNETAHRGAVYVFYTMALISLNLAIFNMLPFPALDGGRLLFILIRAVTGKAVTDEMEGKIHAAGLLLLFGLMIYVTWNDIIKFVVPIFN